MGDVVKIPYQFMVKVGDIVRMPSGETGTVKFVDFVVGGNSKIAFVEPNIVWYKRWWMHLADSLWYCDQEINRLVLLARKEKQERG